MKIWDKGYNVESIIQDFTVGNDRVLDHKLAKYDVMGSKAHVQMLHEVGLLNESDYTALIGGLNDIAQTIEKGEFEIGPEFEDVHSYVEHILTQKVGEAGKKIHMARSRNDQVLVDLHLFAKDEVKAVLAGVKNLFDVLMNLADEHSQIMMPGYTHLQIAMPSSFGLFFSAHAESLIDDVLYLQAAYKMADQNPLGSAAGYGNSFPINRTRTTELLGFAELRYNSIGAQMSRGKLEKSVAFALSSISSTLGKLASDMCLFMSQNFGFVSLPKELTTGSSIMPHKQNPDFFEVLRGKCNQVQAYPVEITQLMSNLTTGYFRDLQLLKESFMNNLDLVKDNLEATAYVMAKVSVNKDILEKEMYAPIYSVEEVNKLVMQGKSFRDAYKEVGLQFLEGDFKPSTEVKHTHEGSVGNLCLEEIKAKMERVSAAF